MRIFYKTLNSALIYFSVLLVLVASFSFGFAQAEEHYHDHEHDHDHSHIGGTEEEDGEKVEELQNEIEELEKKINNTKSQQQTLQREIETFNAEIQLTQLKIEQSRVSISQKEKEIEKLAQDIDELKERIEKLKDSILFQQEVLNERIRERYKSKETSTVIAFFGADTFNSLVQKSEYLKVMEGQDRKLLEKMNNTKDAYDMQKTLFEDKKEQEETLKAQLVQEKTNLESYNTQLANKKAEKDALLEKTKNDEATFQKQLADAQRELNQIVGAVSVLKNTEPRDVQKGELIGIQGNTGMSSGDHLHFGVYRYSSFEEIDGWNWYYSNHVNPAKKLKSKTVYWNTGCESSGNKSVGEGDWSWPLASPTISQGYGTTCWSPIYYGGKPHPALDMWGPYGSPVYAVDDGKAFFCRNCLGDGGNGVFIFHEDDYMTLYWHLR